VLFVLSAVQSTFETQINGQSVSLVSLVSWPGVIGCQCDTTVYIGSLLSY
jgi:hypothetical protein